MFEHIARLFLLLLCFTATPSLSYAVEGTGPLPQNGTSTEEVAVQGIVRSVSLGEQTLTVRPNKGSRITVQVQPWTVFEGFARLEELLPKQQVKVWYLPGEDGNTAVRVEKPLDLGC